MYYRVYCASYPQIKLGSHVALVERAIAYTGPFRGFHAGIGKDTSPNPVFSLGPEYPVFRTLRRQQLPM